MPYFEALKSSACDPKIWSMPVAPGLVHPLLGQVPLQVEQPSPTLPLLFPSFWKMTTHSQLFQNTEAVPTPRHIISQGFFFFFFSSFFWETGIKCSTQANWNTGKILSILSIMHGKCPSCCGTHQQFQTFQQLLLWSQSCPSVTQAAKVAPSLYHLIWAENDRQGSKGSHRRVVGLRVQLLKAVRILPAHPLNEDLPLWSFSIAGNFSKSTTCFSRSPEWKLLFVGMKSMAEIFPSVPLAFKGILALSHPHTPWHRSKPPLCVPLHHVTTVCFSIVYFMPSLVFWKASPVLLDSHTLSLFPYLPWSPQIPFSQSTIWSEP